MKYIKQKGNSALLALIVLALAAAGFIGYIWNIVKLFHMTFSGHEGEAVIRIIGVVTGIVGAVVGYL